MKLKKGIVLALGAGCILGLAACDVNISNLWSSSSASDESTTIEYQDESGNTVTKTVPASSIKTTADSKSSGSTKSQASVTSSSSKSSSISKSASKSAASSSATKSSASGDSITSYLSDYKEYYNYIKLGEVATYGTYFQQIYTTMYEEAEEVLTSTADYEINSSTDSVLLPKIDFQSYKSDITLDMAISVAMSFVYDNPLFYYLKSGYASGYVTKGDVTTYYIYLTMDKEYATADARKAVNEDIISTVNSFKASNSIASMSEYEKAKALNDYITDKISYAYKEDGTTPESSYWAHNIEGLVNSSYNKGVCECYSKSYQLFSNIIGLYSVMATGTATTSSGTGAHAWNYTRIGEKWYGMDTTWNDTSSDYYFLASQDVMFKETTTGVFPFQTKHSSIHTEYTNDYGINYRVPMPTLETSNYSE